ncbi:hypothetical protein EDD21DRAFT_405071 [Dissophora ornata]|nr:hypothetical protein EDD21DRAFT_405071 [Dissophora ornata]
MEHNIELDAVHRGQLCPDLNASGYGHKPTPEPQLFDRQPLKFLLFFAGPVTTGASMAQLSWHFDELIIPTASCAVFHLIAVPLWISRRSSPQHQKDISSIFVLAIFARIDEAKRPLFNHYYSCADGVEPQGNKFVLSNCKCIWLNKSVIEGNRSKELIRSGIDMFSSVFSSKKGNLSPQAALELADIQLESARNAKGSEMTLTHCDEADTVLSRIEKSKRKDLVASSTAEDRILRNGIAATYFALGELLNGLGHREMAHASDKKAEKWG